MFSNRDFDEKENYHDYSKRRQFFVFETEAICHLQKDDKNLNLVINFYYSTTQIVNCVVLGIFMCKCVLCYCHRVSTQLQLPNMSITSNNAAPKVAYSNFHL